MKGQFYINNDSIWVTGTHNLSTYKQESQPIEVEYFVSITATEKGANLVSFDSSLFDEDIITDYCLMEIGSYSYIKIHESDEETITRQGLFLNYKDTGAAVKLNLFKNGTYLYLCPNDSYSNYEKLGYVNVPVHTAWTNVTGAAWIEGPTRKITVKLVDSNGEDVLEKQHITYAYLSGWGEYDENKTSLSSTGQSLFNPLKISETKTKYIVVRDNTGALPSINIPSTYWNVDTDIDEYNTLNIVVTENEPVAVHLIDSITHNDVRKNIRIYGSAVSKSVSGYTPLNCYIKHNSGTLTFSLIGDSGSISPTSKSAASITNNRIDLTYTAG